jgi:hypothetical protein
MQELQNIPTAVNPNFDYFIVFKLGMVNIFTILRDTEVRCQS